MKNHEITLEEMLAQRDKRVRIIEKYQNLYPNKTIVSFKLNIPGPIKNTKDYQKAFLSGIDLIKEDAVDIELFLENKTGPEAILIYDISKEELKKTLIDIEDNHPLGRIYDLDVVGISRSDLNINPRKCLICNEDAHACARSKKHTLKEVLFAIEEILIKAYN